MPLWNEHDRFSTVDMLAELSRPEVIPGQEICDRIIVRTIYTYYANYLHGQDPTHPVSASEILEIHRQSQQIQLEYFEYIETILQNAGENPPPADSVVEGNFRAQLTTDRRTLWDTVRPIRYQLRMLGDIGGTLLLVSDIIGRQIDPLAFENNFLGIDLGTGTGILLAAQDILSRRSGFKTRLLHGIELDPEVANLTRTFSEKLGYIIHEADSAQPSTWQQIPEGPIAFISNENIPAPNEYMGNEPFIPNIQALYQLRSDSILPETAFMPSGLTLGIEDSDRTYRGTPENRFLLHGLQSAADSLEIPLEQLLKWHIKPASIDLEGSPVLLRSASRLGAERMGIFNYQRNYCSRF